MKKVTSFVDDELDSDKDKKLSAKEEKLKQLKALGKSNDDALRRFQFVDESKQHDGITRIDTNSTLHIQTSSV